MPHHGSSEDIRRKWKKKFIDISWIICFVPRENQRSQNWNRRRITKVTVRDIACFMEEIFQLLGRKSVKLKSK